MTLEDLVTICGDGGGDACPAYVLGITDGVRMNDGITKRQALFCIPDHIPDTQLVTTVARLADDDVARYPSDHDLLAASFVVAALVSTYPCQAHR